jgi:hypothetical protein
MHAGSSHTSYITTMDYFTRLAEHQIMTCKTCRHGVLPSQVKSHLSGPKHRIPPERRQEIQEEIATWPELFQTEADLVRLEIPTR